MTHKHLLNETNQARNERLANEYNEYISECMDARIDPVNYINWSASKKHHERNLKTLTAEQFAAISMGREDV